MNGLVIITTIVRAMAAIGGGGELDAIMAALPPNANLTRQNVSRRLGNAADPRNGYVRMDATRGWVLTAHGRRLAEAHGEQT